MTYRERPVKNRLHWQKSFFKCFLSIYYTNTIILKLVPTFYVSVLFSIMGTKDTLLEEQKKQVYKTLKDSVPEIVVLKLSDQKTPSHSENYWAPRLPWCFSG